MRDLCLICRFLLLLHIATRELVQLKKYRESDKCLSESESLSLSSQCQSYTVKCLQILLLETALLLLNSLSSILPFYSICKI